MIPTLALVCAGLSLPSFAGDRKWSLDELTHPDLSVHGGAVTLAPGVYKQSLILDGASLLQVKGAAAATQRMQGFTCAVWVKNPISSAKSNAAEAW